MHRSILHAFFVIGLLSGCDIISTPKGQTASPVPPVGSAVTRNVLLEDCTGHLCSNCPQAAEIADGLKTIYGNRLVVVAVHMSTTFAAPQPPVGDGIYDTDFRTDAGNAYEQQFQIDGLPKGMINRTPYNGLVAIGRGNWSSAVGQLINQPATVNLWFDQLTYDNNTHLITTTVKAALLGNIPAPQNLTLYLTEDHIIDWQIDNRLPLGQQDIPNYDFRHVLRGALNSAWGQALIPVDAQAGDTLVFTGSYPLPSNVLVPSNCSLVAYVYNNAGANRYEVQQVVERKLVP